jgi:hypothetical protein
MTKINTYLAVGGAIVLLLVGVGTYVGWHLHKDLKPCPPVITSTITIHDTIPHYIARYKPWYIQGENAIIHDTIPKDIDTLVILHDYYDRHIYHRIWENDTLKASVTDTITRNKYAGSGFSYKIKVPFTTINNTVDNTVTYNKYIYGGIGIPISSTRINETSVNILYAFPRGYAGVGWSPITNTFIANAGLKICNFKVKK